jgi:hypothetical protein
MDIEMKIDEMANILQNHHNTDEWELVHDFIHENQNFGFEFLSEYPHSWWVTGYQKGNKVILWENYSNEESCESQGAEGSYELMDVEDVIEYVAERKKEIIESLQGQAPDDE